jgi:hypothetical protein
VNSVDQSRLAEVQNQASREASALEVGQDLRLPVLVRGPHRLEIDNDLAPHQEVDPLAFDHLPLVDHLDRLLLLERN